jgi:hypothetical protein
MTQLSRRTFGKALGTAATALAVPTVLSGTASAFSDGIHVTPTANLNTRYRPGLESRILATMAPGTEGEIMNGPVDEDGYTWWGVHWLADDIWGWSAGEFLEPVSDGDDGGNGQKPSVEWIPAYEGNYNNANRGASEIDWVVIHTIEGPASAGVAVFQNPDSNVSAHYIVAKDGHQIQMVHDEDIAWHAGGQNYNDYSIGIEHGGHAGETNFSNPQYKRSAEITRYVADQYGVPLEHPTGVAPCSPQSGGGIIGHHQVPEADCGPNAHTDPGSTWEWDRYMELVRNSG